MKNYEQPGKVIDHTAAAALTSGTALAIGVLLAVPVTDAAIGDTIAVHIEGAFRLPKASASDISQGDLLTWDVSAGEFVVGGTPATGDLVGCAVAVADAAATTTEVVAKLLPGNATVTA